MPNTYEYKFKCPLPNGIHARPANCLEQIVSCFDSKVSVVNLRNNKVANARSVLSLVGADIKSMDECVLRIKGNDSDDAFKKIVRYLKEEFPSCDNALPKVSEPSKKVYVPPVLRTAGVRVLQGNPVVSGFGKGEIVFVKTLGLPEEIKNVEVVNTDDELRKIEKAIAEHRSDITLKLGSGRISVMESEVLKAHLSIASDMELLAKIYTMIKDRKLCAGSAIIQSFEYFSRILKSAQNELIRERIVDLQDVCLQLLRKIYGSSVHDRIVLNKPSVCIADNLTPSQFITMDKSLLSGLVLMQGGNTSHTVILARSFGIPTLTGVKNASNLLENGQETIVDANYGFIIPEINDQVERFYAFEQKKRDLKQKRIDAFKNKTAKTQDGVTLKVMANVALAEEVRTAMCNGADGIGLFRTEMLFMGRDSAPDEQEQFEEYKKAAEYAEGNPVIIRTFDIGGDKNVGYLNLETEKNPFLGYRGVRIYRQYVNLFKKQLRAILRASIFGNLKIMIPMVTCIEEILFIREVLESAMKELDADSVDFNKNIQLGIMLEVPSVVFLIPQLEDIVDFISIGTNDLTQYFLAVDRENKQVSSLYQARHPGILALIKKIVDEAYAHNLLVSICGEMAGQIEYLPLLLGAGIKQVSVSVPYIMEIKAECSEYDRNDCINMLNKAIQSKTIEQVNSILSSRNSLISEKPVIDACLIDLDIDCINKEEVIKYISDVLYVHRRADNPVELEKDFWHREDIYSTGLGYGFAIPHCKTDNVNCNSICVFRLKKPVDWRAIDNVQVDSVIAMAIQDTEKATHIHMKVFSKLARSIMHKDFRQKLRDIEDRLEIIAYLNEKLGLNQR